MGVDVGFPFLINVGRLVFVDRENPPALAPLFHIMVNQLVFARYVRIFLIFVLVAGTADFDAFAVFHLNRVADRRRPGDGYALAGIGNQPVHAPERIAFVGLGGLADGFLSGLPDITLIFQRRISGT